MRQDLERLICHHYQWAIETCRVAPNLVAVNGLEPRDLRDRRVYSHWLIPGSPKDILLGGKRLKRVRLATSQRLPPNSGPSCLLGRGLPAMRSHGHWECEDLLSRYAVVSTKLISHFVK
jgi:hypothetical protein